MKFKIILTTLMFINVTTSSGQILYTDFIPDTTLFAPYFDTNYYLNVDINQDSINDFTFTRYDWHQFATPSCCYCTQGSIYNLDSNSRIGWVDTLFAGGPCRHATVDSGFIISNSSLYWQSNTMLKYECGSLFIYCNQGSTPKFIPLQLYLNGDYYFGWIRIMGYTIIDMAINLTPNLDIVSGELPVGIIKPNKYNILEITPTITTQNIQISNNSSQRETLFLINSFGVVELNFLVNPLEKLILDVSNLKPGIYYIINNNVTSKKRIIKI